MISEVDSTKDTITELLKAVSELGNILQITETNNLQEANKNLNVKLLDATLQKNTYNPKYQ